MIEMVWEYGRVFLVAVIVAVVVFMCFVSRPHQGYYLYTSQEGDFPSYRIYNDWAFCVDTKAYATQDGANVLKVFRQLQDGYYLNLKKEEGE